MSPTTALRAIAHHEARQLRRHPVHQWPYVTQERRAMWMLYLAHGYLPKTEPMTVDVRVRWEDVDVDEANRRHLDQSRARQRRGAA